MNSNNRNLTNLATYQICTHVIYSINNLTNYIQYSKLQAILLTGHSYYM